MDLLRSIAVTRITPPCTAAVYPSRWGLLEQLFAVNDGTIVLLRAPAGYGKTIVLSEFARRVARPVAWVALTGEADDPGIYQLISAALAQIGQEFCPRASSSSSDLRGDLINYLATAPEPVDIVIDGVDAVDHAVRDDLKRLLRDWPTQSRLLLAGRGIGCLSLGRLRLQGKIREYGSDDLRLSQGDLQDMLADAGLSVSTADCANILGAVGGWIAPLRLLLSAAEPPASAAEVIARLGTEPSISEYMEDLFTSMPAAATDLLDTLAVCDEVAPDLAICVSGDPDAAGRLRNLALQSAMVTCPWASQAGFSLDPLARRHRAAGLRAFQPERFRDLHRKAAAWFAKRNDKARALEHSMLAEHAEEIKALLRVHAPSILMGGHHGIVRRAFELLAVNEVTDDAMIFLAVAMAWLEIGDLARADVFIDRAEKASPDLAAPQLADFRGLVLTQRAWLAGEAREDRAAIGGDDPGSMPGPYATVLFEPSLATEKGIAQVHPNGPYAEARSLVSRGLAACAKGDLRRTLEYTDRAQAIITDNAWQATELEAHVTLMRMLVAVLCSRPDQCIALTWEAGSRTPALNVPLLRPPIQTCIGAALFDTGQRSRGLRLMRSVRGSLPDNFIVDTMIPLIATLEFHAATTMGQAEEAQEVLEWGESRLENSAEGIVMRATLAFHRGRYDTAGRMLRPVLEGLVPGLLAWTVGDAWLLESERALRSGNSRNACLALMRAFAIFEQGGVTRTLDYASPEIVELLSQQIGNMDCANGFARTWLAGRKGVPARPLPRFTASEWKILRVLPTHLSLSEIADRLAVSVNTVKTHVKAIYVKLGADSRRTALASAYGSGLLDDGEIGASLSPQALVPTRPGHRQDGKLNEGEGEDAGKRLAAGEVVGEGVHRSA